MRFLLLIFILVGCSHNKVMPPEQKIEAFLPTFDQNAEQITAICQAKMQSFLKTIDEIEALPLENTTFENSLLRLEMASAQFMNDVNPINFLKYVSSDEKARSAADRCETDVSQMFVDVYGREKLFRRIKTLEPKASSLDLITQKLLEEALVAFKRNGLELAEAERKIYLEKKKQLVKLEAEFSTNLVEWKAHLDLTLDELDGMTESYIKALEKTPEGKYRVTLAYPHYVPFLDNAKNAEARKKLEFLYGQKGGTKNRDLLEKAIHLRHELAQMLGFKTHADFVLDRRMAKTRKQVEPFLLKLKTKLQRKAKVDLGRLLKLKKKDEPNATKIHSYDWRYYENELKKTEYQVDHQEIKKYFPIETVLRGMFGIYETLLGVTFAESKSLKTWHPDVKGYEVLQDGSPIAYFLMDLYPRQGKYGHAAAFTLVSGHRKSNLNYQAPVSSIVANFSPPSKDEPSLLEHSEVETLFHEFGHIMHQILTKAKYASQSGTSVKTDFVEAPSQMLESWVWEKVPLQKLSGHYKDPSKKLPDALITQLVSAKLVNASIRYLRQVSFSLIDLKYHTQGSVDSTKEYAKIIKQTMLVPIQEGTMPQAGFGHLMGGYDSGYYGYLWSEVYAADMYTRFEKEGLLDPKTGLDYRRWILEKGGEKEPMDLIIGFLGRKPTLDAFFTSIGL